LGLSFELIVAVVAGTAGFYMAWNIGANDVANAMGTSVGSKALTLKQAVLVAGIFELAGAVLVGAHVTETVRKGIVSPAAFGGGGDAYVYGMLAALLAAGIWLHISTKLGLPVSTTHAIVGAVAGFGVVAGGWGVVNWGKMLQIVVSWFTSPILGGILGYLLFLLVGRVIIDSHSPVRRARRLAPFFVFFTVTVVALSVLYKGLKNLSLDLSMAGAISLSAGIGLVLAVAASFPIRRYLAGKEAHELGDQYLFVERIFRYLQIMTAASVAFAHGSNDVANAVGPLAGIINALREGSVAAKAPVPFWVLMLGGGGIVVGLATWGYKVIYTIGSRITELTPTRGFSAELAAACTIIIGSRLGMPISTTHVLVGSVVGVGMARGMAALNLRMLRDIVSSWIFTVPFTALFAAGIYEVIRLVAR
jgi:PiT family inorganic phosphate transporter